MLKEGNVQQQYVLNDGGGCVCPAMLAQHLLVGVLLWIALEEMFPFLPKITSVSVLKYGTNTFP